MLASEIPLAVIVVVLAFFGSVVLAFAGWIAQKMWQVSNQLTESAAVLENTVRTQADHESRLRAIESLWLKDHERRPTP